MAQSVSNDALWEKLSEISEQLNSLSKKQNSLAPTEEQQKIKEEIVGELEKYIQGLGTHCDSHFKYIYKSLGKLEENADGIYEVLSCMRGIMCEPEEQTKTDDKSYLNFKFFKLRKSSLVIAILGLLVFLLTLFSMKQQNDYALLNYEYYKQWKVVRQLEVDKQEQSDKQVGE